MITDVISLIETLRKLIQRKSELDKEYFEDFIHPAWKPFVIIHEDYKTSFSKYAEFSSRDDIEIGVLVDGLLDMLRKDSLYSADLRSELAKMTKYLPSKKMMLKTREDKLINFVRAIYEYFQMDDVQREISVFINLRARIVRSISFLNRKENNIDREKIELIFESSFELIQSEYEKVADAYYSLRQEFMA